MIFLLPVPVTVCSLDSHLSHFSYFSQNFSPWPVFPDSWLKISTFKAEKTRKTWFWQRVYYSYNAQLCGSFNSHQDGSGSFLQKGWAPRVYRLASQLAVCMLIPSQRVVGALCCKLVPKLWNLWFFYIEINHNNMDTFLKRLVWQWWDQFLL